MIKVHDLNNTLKCIVYIFIEYLKSYTIIKCAHDYLIVNLGNTLHARRKHIDGEGLATQRVDV